VAVTKSTLQKSLFHKEGFREIKPPLGGFFNSGIYDFSIIKLKNSAEHTFIRLWFLVLFGAA
jgi:hypothetical protein